MEDHNSAHAGSGGKEQPKGVKKREMREGPSGSKAILLSRFFRMKGGLRLPEMVESKIKVQEKC